MRFWATVDPTSNSLVVVYPEEQCKIYGWDPEILEVNSLRQVCLCRGHFEALMGRIKEGWWYPMEITMLDGEGS